MAVLLLVHDDAIYNVDTNRPSRRSKVTAPLSQKSTRRATARHKRKLPQRFRLPCEGAW
jgi:hypothetical protein